MSEQKKLDNSEKRSIYTDLLMNISFSMLNATDENTFFESTLEQIGKVINVSRIYIFDYEKSIWSNTYEWVAPGISSQIATLQNISMKDMDEEHAMLHCLLRGEVFSFVDVMDIADEITRETLTRQKIHSVLAVPLYFEGRVQGMFGFDICDACAQWPSESIDLIIGIGNLLSSAKGHFHMRRILRGKEQQIRDIVDAFPDPVYVADMQTHQVLFVNKCLQDKFETHDLLTMKCHKIFQNLDEPCSFCSNAILHLGDPPFIWKHHNDVLHRDYKVIDRCIAWEGQRKVRLSIALDITDVLKSQREEVLARESSLAKGLFLANMSHEIRTPLNGIIGLNYLALHANTSPVVNDYLLKMQSSSKTLLGIVNDILDFSKIDAGKLELENIPFGFRDVVQSIQNMVLPQTREKKLQLLVNIDPDIPDVVYGDSLRFSQVLLNIVSNAVKFTSHGEVSVAAQVQGRTQGAISIQVSVHDTGIGMSEEQLQSLFTEFRQADCSMTRKYGGTGLGLAIAKRLVEMMEGTISVNSHPGEGTTFEFLVRFGLPNSVTPSDLVLSTALPPVRDAINLQGIKVLLAEDNVINQIIAAEILRQQGCSVDIATDGHEAVEKVDRYSYDIVLMDIQMPNMDGFEATRRIREQKRFVDLPIIAMTAHAMQGDYDKSIAAGMQDHVTKPIDPDSLYETIRRWVRK